MGKSDKHPQKPSVVKHVEAVTTMFIEIGNITEIRFLSEIS